ncbi:MAG TPA: hypothetical protein VFZ61_28660 [Polyangiales bacterium]
MRTRVHHWLWSSVLSGALGLLHSGCDSAPGSTPDGELASAEGALHGGHGRFERVPRPDNAYTLFETLQVRPLALSPNGKRLFALNTPDNTLEIYKISGFGLHHEASVAVGLEPVAVAARSDEEVWVVNHLSDSVSIVDVGRGTPAVVRTLWVGDEPRDLVFAGPDRSRAFVTTAHRGQNSPDDPDLFNAAAGRADVWVFDANDLGAAANGQRLTKITLFADTPRALAVSPDGSRVYAAPFFSGNQTTVVSADAVRQLYASRVNPANRNQIQFNGVWQPITGLVVKYKAGADGTSHWYDAEGTNFDAFVRVSLPDNDVFTIDASAAVPAAVPGAAHAHVGTTLFNMAVGPRDGKIYVSNTEAHNDVRFEGHNPTLSFTSVRGTAVDSRISVIDPVSGQIVHNDLNPHVVDGVGERHLSRAFPQDMAITDDGRTLVVAAQGSAKLAVYDTADLNSGRAPASWFNQVALSAGGPSGVVLDDRNRRAFVLTRFDNGISSVDLRFRLEVGHTRMHNPEPARVTAGRRFLYDATLTSDNGTQACAGCHVGGDLDALSWDLGNPGAIPLPITKLAEHEDVLFTVSPSELATTQPLAVAQFDANQPLKGPMTTQSLRGMANHGSMHWRGDRNGAVQQDGQPFVDPATGAPVVSAQPDQGIFDEVAAFDSFNVAFVGLLGRDRELTAAQMRAFTHFALELTYPPNPIRNLDNSLTPTQQAGRNFYFQVDASGNELPVDRFHNCNGCHRLDPEGNAGASRRPGFFGSDGRLSFENLPQIFKVAHLRNAYQKVGMFASSPDANRTLTNIPTLNPPLPAVRGFGYQPDGAVGTIEHHLSGQGFIRTTTAIGGVSPNPGGIPTFIFTPTGTTIDPAGFPLRRAIASFLLAYDSNLRPVVGQQLTLTSAVGAALDARLALLSARASQGDCDLIAKGRIDGSERGFVYVDGSYRSDRSREPRRTEAELRALLDEADEALTFSCVPSGSGYRMGIDRDADGYADRDELAARTDPTSSRDHP